MNAFQAIRLVASRELKERGRSRAYIISTILTVLLLGGAIALPTLIGGGPSTYTIGVVGEGADIVATADAIARQEADDDEESNRYEAMVFEDTESAEAALDEGEIEAVIVDGEELVAGSAGAFGGSTAERSLQEAAGTHRVQELVTGSEEAAEVVQILASEPLEFRRLGGTDEEEDNLRGMVAFAGLILMYIAILSYGSWMLSGVTEEKTNRVVEVLMSTLRPWHILGGKLIGIGILGLGQMLVLIIAGLLGIILSGAFEIPALPFDSVAALIGWFILGFLLYAILYGAAGSLVSRMEDAQNAAAPLTIVALVGYLFSFAALNDPEGAVAVIGTYIPFSAPYVAPIRLAIGDISAWEMAVAVAITVATIVVLVRLAGRVYAGGLLRYGGRIKWGEAFRSAE
ncbi:MAG TPA: ABC transporter permease [Acidimicrobiia bacterium]|nr:ABC transporter permease [Acidimicrobiia bacterium]